MEDIKFPVINLEEIIAREQYTCNAIVNKLIEYSKEREIRPFSEIRANGRCVGMVSPCDNDHVVEWQISKSKDGIHNQNDYSIFVRYNNKCFFISY